MIPTFDFFLPNADTRHLSAKVISEGGRMD